MKAKSNYEAWDEQMDRAHAQICKENMRYAVFRAQKT